MARSLKCSNHYLKALKNMAEIPIEEIMVLAEMTNALDVVEEAIGRTTVKLEAEVETAEVAEEALIDSIEGVVIEEVVDSEEEEISETIEIKETTETTEITEVIDTEMIEMTVTEEMIET